MAGYIADSNFLINLFERNTQNKDHALSILKDLTYEGGKLYIPYIVCAEITVGMSNPKQIMGKCRLLSDNFIPILETDLINTHLIPQEKRKQLKAIDCILIAMCHRLKAKLITFDEKLECIVDEVLNT